MKFDKVMRYAYLGGGLVAIGLAIASEIVSLKKEIKRYQGVYEEHVTYHEYLTNELKASEARLKRLERYEDLGQVD